MRRPGRKPGFLNVRQHLEHVEEVLQGFLKYGDCPLIRDEVRKASLIGRSIMRKHDELRKGGNRKDIAL